jgi:hypothetical protein
VVIAVAGAAGKNKTKQSTMRVGDACEFSSEKSTRYFSAWGRLILDFPINREKSFSADMRFL